MNPEDDINAYIFPRAGKWAIQKVQGENGNGPSREVFWAEDLTFEEAKLLAADCPGPSLTSTQTPERGSNQSMTRPDLNTASGQEVFDFVISHLRNQKVRSMRGSGTSLECAYRGQAGTSCAVGCLIPDGIYRLSMEVKSVYTLVSTIPEFSIHLRLLERLQTLHDYYMLEGMSANFEGQVGCIAHSFDFIYRNPV